MKDFQRRFYEINDKRGTNIDIYNDLRKMMDLTRKFHERFMVFFEIYSKQVGKIQQKSLLEVSEAQVFLTLRGKLISI